jgi:hypothetical protein
LFIYCKSHCTLLFVVICIDISFIRFDTKLSSGSAWFSGSARGAISNKAPSY